MKPNHTVAMETCAPLQPVILVTGGYGLLGSHLVPLLVKNVPRAQIIVNTRNKKQCCLEQVETIPGDLQDRKLWIKFPDTITHVFHLAAVIPWKAEDKNRASLVTDNVLPLANLIEQGRRWPNLQQIVYTSSVSVYAQTDQRLTEDSLCRPASLYGAAKLTGEQLLRNMDLADVRTVSLRLSSLYAYGQYGGTVLPIMVGRALAKQDIVIFGDGTRTQDFLHCEDAARALLLCFEKEAQGVYNVGTGTPVTMTELAQTASRVFSDGETKIAYEPTKADGDPGIKLDISKARRELSYEPQVQLEQGLRKLKQEMESIKE
ncbi:MAG TPA: NAD(P)-dependent oxidoreductase [Pyrinomonadaceae bacterium]|jgi:UDP-glucose 4-epimerase